MPALNMNSMHHNLPRQSPDAAAPSASPFETVLPTAGLPPSSCQFVTPAPTGADHGNSLPVGILAAAIFVPIVLAVLGVWFCHRVRAWPFRGGRAAKRLRGSHWVYDVAGAREAQSSMGNGRDRSKRRYRGSVTSAFHDSESSGSGSGTSSTDGMELQNKQSRRAKGKARLGSEEEPVPMSRDNVILDEKEKEKEKEEVVTRRPSKPSQARVSTYGRHNRNGDGYGGDWNYEELA